MNILPIEVVELILVQVLARIQPSYRTGVEMFLKRPNSPGTDGAGIRTQLYAAPETRGSIRFQFLG
jgi:hypothetical protein